MIFRKALAKFYRKWYEDALNSGIYCDRRGDTKTASHYYEQAGEYRDLIENYGELIDFFSVGDRAHIKDSALPERYRGIE